MASLIADPFPVLFCENTVAPSFSAFSAVESPMGLSMTKIKGSKTVRSSLMTSLTPSGSLYVGRKTIESFKMSKFLISNYRIPSIFEMFSVNEMSRGAMTLVRALSMAWRVFLVSVDISSFEASRSISRMSDMICPRVDRLIILIIGAMDRLR